MLIADSTLEIGLFKVMLHIFQLISLLKKTSKNDFKNQFLGIENSQIFSPNLVKLCVHLCYALKKTPKLFQPPGGLIFGLEFSTCRIL